MKYLLAVIVAAVATMPTAAPGPAAVRAAAPMVQAQATPFAPFVGTWERRDAWLTVFEDGFAVFRWKVGFCLPTEPPPCDFVDQNGVPQPGGRVEIRFSRVQNGEPPIAEGQVLSSNARHFEPGPVWLVRASPELVALTQYAPTTWLCREPRDIKHCL